MKITPPELVDEEAFELFAAGGVAAGQTFSKVAFRQADLTASRAADLRCEEVVFAGTTLRRSVWQGVSLVDARLKACDLSNADWQHARMQRVEFESCNLTGANFSNAQIHHARFAGCKLLLAPFLETKFSACAFTNCNLEQADFTGTDLRQAVFDHCRLGGARFFGAQLAGADLRGSDLARLGVTAQELRGAIVEQGQLVQIAPLLGVVVK
jgi:uncharacterized protein YjbI with pentapeptide repeats